MSFLKHHNVGSHLKVNLGITTLLAMSILLLMVSDQMPTTSDLIPLIGWFFLSIILLISLGTVLTSIIILVHQQVCLSSASICKSDQL